MVHDSDSEGSSGSETDAGTVMARPRERRAKRAKPNEAEPATPKAPAYNSLQTPVTPTPFTPFTPDLSSSLSPTPSRRPLPQTPPTPSPLRYRYADARGLRTYSPDELERRGLPAVVRPAALPAGFTEQDLLEGVQEEEEEGRLGLNNLVGWSPSPSPTTVSSSTSPGGSVWEPLSEVSSSSSHSRPAIQQVVYIPQDTDVGTLSKVRT
jgi:hypothetical protein